MTFVATGTTGAACDSSEGDPAREEEGKNEQTVRGREERRYERHERKKSKKHRKRAQGRACRSIAMEKIKIRKRTREKEINNNNKK